jgi:hypothetical protein
VKTTSAALGAKELFADAVSVACALAADELRGETETHEAEEAADHDPTPEKSTWNPPNVDPPGIEAPISQRLGDTARETPGAVAVTSKEKAGSPPAGAASVTARK